MQIVPDIRTMVFTRVDCTATTSNQTGWSAWDTAFFYEQRALFIEYKPLRNCPFEREEKINYNFPPPLSLREIRLDEFMVWNNYYSTIWSVEKFTILFEEAEMLSKVT